jgi:hypothetical protein
VRKYPTAHQRCRTEFLVVVIALSILMFSLVGRQTPVVMIASRILLIPVIAAVGGCSGSAHGIGRTGSSGDHDPRDLGPKITTRQPTDDMIEVAIVSMEQAGRRRRDDPRRQRGVRARAARAGGGPVQGRRDAGTRPSRPGRSRRTAGSGSPPAVAGQLPIPVETERPAPGA